MHHTKKTKADPSRGEMSDTLSEAALAYQKRVKSGKLATKSVAPHFATDTRNFDHRGLQKPAIEKRTTPRDKVSPPRSRFASEDKPPSHGISKSNSSRERAMSNGKERVGSSGPQRAGSRDGVSSTPKDRPPTHPPSSRPHLKKTGSARLKSASPDRPSTPSIEHNVDRLLINVKLMKESLRHFLDVDQELGAAMEHCDPSDDLAIFEALWVVKRGVEELAVMKAKLHNLEPQLKDSKAMQLELAQEMEELCVARSERDQTIEDLKQKMSSTDQSDQEVQGSTQTRIDEAVAKAVAEERKASKLALDAALKKADIAEQALLTARPSNAALDNVDVDKMHALAEKTDKVLKDKSAKKAVQEERQAMVMWVAASVEAERLKAAEQIKEANQQVSEAVSATKQALDRAEIAEKKVKTVVVPSIVTSKDATKYAELVATQEAAKREMEVLSDAGAGVRESRDMSEDFTAMIELKKSMDTRQKQIDLLAPSTPPPPRTPESARSSESSTTENSAMIVGVWQLIVSHCQANNTTLSKVWSNDFDRSQTGKSSLAQFTRGVERCGCKSKGKEAEMAFDDIKKKRKGSFISLEEFISAAEFWVTSLGSAERLSLGMTSESVDSLERKSEGQAPKASPQKPTTRRARHSMPGSTTTPTSRSKSPKSRSIGRGETLKRKTFKEAEKPFDLSEELAHIIGQDKLKEQLLAFEKGIELQARRKELGIECSEQLPPHMMFCGNPGTGKTTIARLVGMVLKKLGVLKKGHLVEVQRSDLVAGAIGQTALKTREKINEARGGVLFVDEAYTLAPLGSAETKDFGREAINEIMSVMNDGDPVVIFAGYQKEMETFVHANAGLFRRIDVRYDFADYSTMELAQILRKEVTAAGFNLHSSIEDEAVSQLLDASTNDGLRTAMGGGLSRQLFRKARGKLDAELSLDSSPEEMCTLSIQHLEDALSDISDNPVTF